MSPVVLSLILLGAPAAEIQIREVPTTGLYVETTPPGATIKLDGKPNGFAPKTFVVPPEATKMTVEVELDGHAPGRREVEIRGGRVTRVEFRLPPTAKVDKELKPKEKVSAGVAEDSGYGNRAHSLVLLEKKQVQDELKLDKAQTAKLEEMEAARPNIAAVADRAKRQEKNIELGKVAEKLLSPSQYKRFREISLQIHGLSAMTDSVVTEELRLSKDQQEHVRSIKLKFIQQRNALPPGDREKQFFRLQNEAMNEVIALLSSEQRQRFNEMKGEPFDVEALSGRPRAKATINGTIRGSATVVVTQPMPDGTAVTTRSKREFAPRKGPTLHLSEDEVESITKRTK